MTATASPLCAPARESVTDRCPGAVALHAAEDGALARVRIPGGRVSAGQARALASAASSLGNGLVDLTSRANVQLRGLADGAGDELGQRLFDAGLLPSLEHDRARNILASPVAGRHPDAIAAVDDVVVALDQALCADPALTALPGKWLFAVDDGSGLALDQVADVALVAVDDERFTLQVAGRPTTARLSAADAISGALAVASAFLALRDREWRLAELKGSGLELPGRPGNSRPDPFIPQRDGLVSVTALAPLGRLDAATLGSLAGLAPELRVGTRRTVTLPDLAPATADAIAAELTALGMVVGEDSGWDGLTACAGLGACPKALADVRAAAARRAAVREPGAPAEHWSACGRRCGERADQPVSVVATPAGVTVRRDGRDVNLTSTEDALAVLA